ncbi:TPA: 4-hydroxy-3-methylbut-2-enyl diphosphate reductase [Candidatus Bipolaricaulota bacterium]|nr:4-hydroxy-3-methylbut-2-enyl diphosphate reductase [Candidatus Bipolaricaulota bacterium]
MGDGLRIELARVYGFCPGVRRAVQMVEDHLAREGPLATLGAIVHNAHVVEALQEKGARVAGGVCEVGEPTVAITAHGAGQEIYREIQERGLKLVDTTCPIVKRAQEAARALAQGGYTVLIYGEESHPEVRGILSWTEGKGHATMSPDDLPELATKKLAIVSQTTKDQKAFWGFVREVIARVHPALKDLRVVDTTCPETGRRYQAAVELAREVEAIFVVGSRNSANTRKLAETCRGTGVRTYFIESAEEIEPGWLSGLSRVGVTAGASTPDEVIDQVLRRLSQLGGEAA